MRVCAEAWLGHAPRYGVYFGKLFWLEMTACLPARAIVSAASFHAWRAPACHSVAFGIVLQEFFILQL